MWLSEVPSAPFESFWTDLSVIDKSNLLVVIDHDEESHQFHLFSIA